MSSVETNETAKPGTPAAVNWHRPVPMAQSATLSESGKLPLNEVLSDRVGAGSPFGDDVTFPVDPRALNYYHPQWASGSHDHAETH